MSDENQYDEFGNYLGPELSDSDDSDSDSDGGSGVGSPASESRSRSASLSAHHGADSMDLDSSNFTAPQPPPLNQVVLHEDKQLYPSSLSTYGDAVNVQVLDEDTQALEEGIIKPLSTTTFLPHGKGNALKFKVPLNYALNLCAEAPGNFVRSAAVVGHLKSGKSTFLHGILKQSLAPAAVLKEDKDIYALAQEKSRCMSLKSCPVSIPMTTSIGGSDDGKTILAQLVDCPGHLNFYDEVLSTISSVDTTLILISAVTGLLPGDEISISHSLKAGNDIVIVITMVDKLIVDLHLPPNDAYFKLLNVLDHVNVYTQRCKEGAKIMSPERGNVMFSSGRDGWLFSLSSFSARYFNQWENKAGFLDGKKNKNPIGGLTQEAFAKRLWGDAYLDSSTGKFTQKCPVGGKRTFVEFVLEPIYKVYSSCLGGDKKNVIKSCLGEFGIKISSGIGGNGISGSDDETVRLITKYMNVLLPSSHSTLANVLYSQGKSPLEAAAGKVSAQYRGSPFSNIVRDMRKCKSEECQLMIQVCKLYANNVTNESLDSSSASDAASDADASAKTKTLGFKCYGRVLSGSLKVGDRVRVLGSNYSTGSPFSKATYNGSSLTSADDEDVSYAVVESLHIPHGGRYETAVERASAGMWVLIGGVDGSVNGGGGCTITSDVDYHSAKNATTRTTNDNDNDGGMDSDDEISIEELAEPPQSFTPPSYYLLGTSSTIKLSVEPLNPSNLPKMLAGLRAVTKSYPMSSVRIEESGEHSVYGTGELYLDCVMFELRNMFQSSTGGAGGGSSGVEIKVSDPSVRFNETVLDSSSVKCYATSSNKLNSLTFLTEPLDEGLGMAIEGSKFHLAQSNKDVASYLQKQYNWDILSARSIWAFGPTSTSPNVLMDDTLPSTISKASLNTVKGSVIQGFQWATREGPLCEEPVRNTKIKLLDITLAESSILRGGGQIIPAARRAIYSSLLTAEPRIMEPVLRLSIIIPSSIVGAITNLITKRRGYVTEDQMKEGTTLSVVKGYMPVIDSFGFEVDLRSFTQGSATLSSILSHYAIVPGDPLDRSIILHPLEPSPVSSLGREFMIKTRRRKGLSEEVGVVKYFDEDVRKNIEDGGIGGN